MGGKPGFSNADDPEAFHHSEVSPIVGADREVVTEAGRGNEQVEAAETFADVLIDRKDRHSGEELLQDCLAPNGISGVKGTSSPSLRVSAAMGSRGTKTPFENLALIVRTVLLLRAVSSKSFHQRLPHFEESLRVAVPWFFLVTDQYRGPKYASPQFSQTSAGTFRITMTATSSSNLIVAVPGEVRPCLHMTQIIPVASSWP